MFDTRSDYALNKLDKTAIVYPSITGEDTRLKQEDFDSQEEFEHWKNWSDDNYHKAETAGWNDSRCLSFETQRGEPVPSVEDVVLAPYIAAEQMERRRRMLEQIRTRLTEKQYRRWWLHCIMKISVIQIAQDEDVAEPSVSESITRAREIISKIFSETLYLPPSFHA